MPNNFPNNYTRRPKPVASAQDSENIITEQTGYMSTQQLVENMVLAGKRLHDYRHGLLDVQGDEEDDSYDEEQDAAVPYERDLVDEAIDVEQKVVEKRKRNQGAKEDPLPVETVDQGGGSGEPEVRNEGETSPS